MTVTETTRPEPARRLRPLLPGRLRPLDRPRMWVEPAFTAVGYWAYTLTRNAVPAHRTAALHRAQAIWHAERLLHVNIELGINAAEKEQT